MGRRIEIVHRKLGGGLSLSSMQHSVTSAHSISDSSSSKIKKHNEKVPILVSHWAVRVELQENGGIEDQLTTWKFFGLVTPGDGTCELTSEKFQSLDKPRDRICATTYHSLDTIEYEALFSNSGYAATTNNCQDFATTFFLTIIEYTYKLENVINMLSKGRYFQHLLRDVTETEKGQGENGNSIVEMYRRIRGRNNELILEFKMGLQQSMVRVGQGAT